MGSGRGYYRERERDADNLTNALVCFGNLCPLDNSFTCLDTLKCTLVCLWDSWLDTLGCTGKCCNAVFFSMSLGFLGRSGRKQSFCKWGDVKNPGTSGKGRPEFAKFANLMENHPSPIALLSLSCSFSFFFPSRMEEEMGMHVFFYVCGHACVSSLLVWVDVKENAGICKRKERAFV